MRIGVLLPDLMNFPNLPKRDRDILQSTQHALSVTVYVEDALIVH